MAQPNNSEPNLYGESLNPDTVIRINRHERDYVTIANATVQDNRLSWETRGLLVYLLSLPADWNIRVSHLQNQGNAGRDALRRMLRELQQYGYASGVGRENQERSERGRFGRQTEIRIYESPALNPLYSEENSPSPENPFTVDSPATVEPFAVNPSPENPSTYKVQNLQKTDLHKTHTQQTDLRAVGAPVGGVGEGSKFSLAECRRYAEHLHASGQGINNPGGFARKIHHSGSEDEMIALFLQEGTEAMSTISADKCPDCRAASGMVYVDANDFSKGVRRCKHPKLFKNSQEASYVNH